MTHGIIYKATAPNGKAYVGQTTQTLDDRKGSGYKESPAFDRALKKYGAAIVWEVIAECETQAELDAAEVAAIARENTIAPFGYNLKEGGRGGKMSAQTRAQMSAAQMGNKNALGFKHTAQTRAKMSAAQMGNQRRKGKTITPEHRAKLLAGYFRSLGKCPPRDFDAPPQEE